MGYVPPPMPRPITRLEALRREFVRGRIVLQDFEADVETLMREGREDDAYTPEPGGLPPSSCAGLGW